MSLVDSLISSYVPSDDATFDVVLPKGEVLKFRAVRDYSEIRKLATAGVKWHKAAHKNPSPQIATVLTDDEGTSTQAHMMAVTSVEPKLTEYDILKLAKEAGWLFLEIVRQYDQKQANRTAMAEVEELDELGEDSAPM